MYPIDSGWQDCSWEERDRYEKICTRKVSADLVTYVKFEIHEPRQSHGPGHYYYLLIKCSFLIEGKVFPFYLGENQTEEELVELIKNSAHSAYMKECNPCVTELLSLHEAVTKMKPLYVG